MGDYLNGSFRTYFSVITKLNSGIVSSLSSENRYPCVNSKSLQIGQLRLSRDVIPYTSSSIVSLLYKFQQKKNLAGTDQIKIIFTLFLSILIGCSKFFNQSESSNPAQRKIMLKIFFIGLVPALCGLFVPLRYPIKAAESKRVKLNAKTSIYYQKVFLILVLIAGD